MSSWRTSVVNHVVNLTTDGVERFLRRDVTRVKDRFDRADEHAIRLSVFLCLVALPGDALGGLLPACRGLADVVEDLVGVRAVRDIVVWPHHVPPSVCVVMSSGWACSQIEA